MGMLVLHRKRGESVYIGPDVKLEVVDVRGGNVVLGFTAPPSVCIDREEIRRKRDEEREWNEFVAAADEAQADAEALALFLGKRGN